MSGQHNISDLSLTEQCIERIATGDRDAFEQLYQITHASIYAFALSLVNNPHDAQDIVHDAFLKIYVAAPSYQANGTPMAWIMTITKNLARSKIRERKKTAELAPEEWEQHLPPVEDTDREDRFALTEMLKTLSEEERKIVTLHGVADMKHREIAELLDMPLATVLTKYHRAIKKLKQAL